MTPVYANVLPELEWRGFVQQATPGLAEHFAKGPVRWQLRRGRMATKRTPKGQCP